MGGEEGLEAIEGALLLALLVGIVQRGHASLKVSTLSFDTQTGVAFLLDGLEGMASGAALLAHDVELVFEICAFFLELVQVGLVLCTGGL